RARARPARTSSTGSGMAVRPARRTTTATAASRPTSSSRVSMSRQRWHAAAAAATWRPPGRFASCRAWNSLSMDDPRHPHEREWPGALPEVDEETFLRVLADAIRVAGGTGLPHAFMGGIASTALGRPRWTHGIDLCVRREDARAMLGAFADAGYDTEETDQSWLYKAVKGGVLVDVIFESTGGIVLDDGGRRGGGRGRPG